MQSREELESVILGGLVGRKPNYERCVATTEFLMQCEFWLSWLELELSTLGQHVSE